MQISVRTPAHLWIVGIVATLWNGFGCYDYLMTQTNNQAYLAQFTEAQRAYFDSFPALAQGAWALGVWGGLAGSLLLLARSRWAVTAFAVSLFGLAASTIYQHLLSTMPPDLVDGAMMALTVAIWVIVIGLLLYAIAMQRRGVLR
jgi:hypothetical protein